MMVTRRTLRRTHLFRPDAQTRQLYLYRVAVLTRALLFTSSAPAVAAYEALGFKRVGDYGLLDLE